jgi:hypothetical protein
MASRRSTPKELQDAVRDAVERTLQATVGSAERTRTRAQGAVDDVVGTVDELVRGAEAGLAKSRRAVADALPATQEDLRALRSELRRIGRRLDAIEERLPSGTRGGGKKSRGR